METNPEIRIATAIVTANSFSRRPTMPPMNSTGTNTATSDAVIATMVKPTSCEPSRAACMRGLPISMCRAIFSSMTIASSTINPTLSVSAMSDRLSRLNFRRYIAANVATIATGNVTLGMSVAVRLRKKMKMTTITSPNAIQSVIFTSCTDSRIESERSVRTSSDTPGGNCARNEGSNALISSTIPTTFEPGCF